MSLLLGIDVGTYRAKGALVRGNGDVVSTHAVDLELEIPRQGHAEHDPEQTWWASFTRICQNLLDSTGRGTADEIEAIGISSIAPAVVPVDSSGSPLRKAILYGIDTRADEEIDTLNQSIGRQTIFETCGHHLSAQSAGPKILWIRNNEPDVYRNTHKFLAGTSYLHQKLTGEAVLDHYTAVVFSPLYDIRLRDWSPDLVPEVTERDKLPELAWSHQIVGTVRPEAAEETGLAEGTPVVGGTADALSEAISVGATRPGELMIMYGSSTFFIQAVEERPRSENLWPSLHAVPDRYSVTGGTATAGSITRWFYDQWVDSGDSSISLDEGYERLTRRAGESPPGANGLVTLPYFSGERTPLHDPHARGVFFGLTLKHSLGDLYRSILEGIGFSIRHNMESMESIGVTPRRVVAVGGGVKSDVWLQSVSDICDITQLVPQVRIGAAYGDAFLAALGSDLYSDLDEVKTWVDYSSRIEPRSRYRSRYDRYYQIYRTLQERTQSSMHELHQIQQEGEQNE